MWRLLLVCVFVRVCVAAEESLPPHALARLGSPGFHNPDGVLAGAISPDGKLLALSSTGGLRVWDAETGVLLWQSEEIGARVGMLAFDSAGERLFGLRMDAGTLSSWRAKTGAELACVHLEGVDRHVRVASAAADRLAVVADDRRVLLFRLLPNRMLWGRTWLHGEVRRIAISPDGTRVATADHEGSLRMLDAEGHESWRSSEDGRPVTALAFDSGGNVLAAGNDEGSVDRFDVATGEFRRTIQGDGDWAMSLAFSPDGRRLAMGADDGEVHLWGHVSGARVWRIRFIPDPIGVLLFSPNKGRLVAASEIGAVRYLDLATGQDCTPGEGHLDPVVALGFSKDGHRLVSGGIGGGVVLWNLDQYAPEWRKRDGRFGVLSVAFDAKGDPFWVTDGAEMRRQVHGSRAEEVRHLGDLERLRAADISPDAETIAAVPYDEPPGLWDVAMGAQRQWAASQRGERIALSPDGSLAALVQAGSIEIHDWQGTGASEHFAVPTAGDVQDLSFSRDARYLAVTAEGGASVVVYEIAQGPPEVARVVPGSFVSSVEFGLDGRTLAIGCADGRVELWDLALGAQLETLEGHRGHVTALAASRDLTRLASGSTDHTVIVWDLTKVRREAGTRPDPEACWADLETADRSYAALWRLVELGDDATRFLAGRIGSEKPDDERVQALIRRLDSDEFEEREAASAALAGLAAEARPALESALSTTPSAEVRARIERLLSAEGGIRISLPQTLRAVRAVTVIEHIGTPAAREALSRVAAGDPRSRITVAARAALERLDARE